MAIPDVSTLFSSTVLASKKPFVVYFSASWCGPCRVLKPLLEAAAEEHKDAVSFGAVDVDQASGLLQKYNIRSVPTLLLFKSGHVVGQTAGLLSKDKLEEFILR